MTTTIVRDSIVGDEWIKQAYAVAPPQRIIDPKTMQPTGNFLSGPVRLSFINLFKLPAATAQIPNPKFNAIGLFTPLSDMTIFHEEYYAVCAKNFAEYWNADAGNYVGLHSPFHDQVEKSQKYKGYTPRCTYITFSTQYKPQIVDSRGNLIVDESKVYPGVWAILSVNAYPYGKGIKGPSKIGVGYGIQSVMIIGDDMSLGGGGVDPATQFKGINVSAPIARPDFSKMPQGQQPPGQQPLPGMPPQVPTTHWAPPPPPVAQVSDDDAFMSQFA